MSSRRLQQIICKASLLVMLFASLAPTVSYALASHSNPNLFQEICSSNGVKKVVMLQVLTTQGNQLSTVLAIKQSQPASSHIGTHFEHCPFCSHHIAVIAPSNLSNTLFVAGLNAFQRIPTYDSPFIQRVVQRANPPQAPPLVSIY